MSKKRGRKTTRLPMMRRIISRIRYHKRLQNTSRRKRKQVRCVMCGTGAGLTEIISTAVSSFHLCRTHLAEERRES